MDLPVVSEQIINQIESRAMEYSLDVYGTPNEATILSVKTAMLIGASIALQVNMEDDIERVKQIKAIKS